LYEYVAAWYWSLSRGEALNSTDSDCTLDDRAYKVYTDKVTWIKYL